MPIYEYKCPDCGHTFDAIQKMSDDPIRVCPKCAAQDVRKLISATSFVLKGSGWYKDHYGLKKGGGESGESKPAGEVGGTSGESAAPAAAAPAAPAAAATPASGSGSGSGTPAAG